MRPPLGLGLDWLRSFKESWRGLKEIHPERLRRKVILLIYASLPTFELIEEAKERGIWLLKAAEEFHRPEKLFLEP
ncbi:MAG: hypothetical protein ACP5QI_06230 [Candidatus Bathyarchaeia archaeon]